MVNDVTGGRGDAGMAPLLARLGVPYVCMHSRGIEGPAAGARESPAGGAWYVCEASDVKENTKHLMGTGKTIREAFENFCQRAETVLSDHPEDVERANGYGTPEERENMKEQALRCFRKAN
jgi:hypothetical protein